MRLYRYVIPRDFGFAPNPFFGFCTLACCKPEIRERAQVGDLVLGINGRPQNKRPIRHYDRLVYAMRVSETLSFNSYWDDARFQQKKAIAYASRMHAFGDNIYMKNDDGFWIQAESHHTLYNGDPNDQNIRTDTGVDRVLISNDFAYWGGSGPLSSSLAEEHWVSEVFDGGRRAHKCNFSDDVVSSFEAWYGALTDRGYLGRPERWDAGAAEVTTHQQRRKSALPSKFF
jgi:hypothetical protein